MVNWIRVEDELPPPHEQDESYSIQVLITDGTYIASGYHEYEYFAENLEDDLQYSSDVWHDDSHYLMADHCGWPMVTHWAYLPELPARKNDGIPENAIST